MDKLGIDSSKYPKTHEKIDRTSYVLINPSSEFELQSSDIVYLLKPGHKQSTSVLSNNTIINKLNEHVLSSKRNLKSTTQLNSKNNHHQNNNYSNYQHVNHNSNNNETTINGGNTLNINKNPSTYLTESKSEAANIYLISDDETSNSSCKKPILSSAVNLNYN